MGIGNAKKMVQKALMLASLLPRRPQEGYDRLRTRLEIMRERQWVRRPEYRAGQWQDVIARLQEWSAIDMESVLRERSLVEIEGEVRRRISEIRGGAPFPIAYNADIVLARLSYAVCRAARPSIVLETGVAYGVTSAFILRALEANGQGTLHSVDLPPLGRDAERFVGVLIPEGLRRHWHLHRGTSRRVLPKLLPELKRVDVFLHDSLHTRRNMRWEFQAVAPWLGPAAVVIADDIQGNSAFLDWVSMAKPAFWTTLGEVEKENSLLGLSVGIESRDCQVKA